MVPGSLVKKKNQTLISEEIRKNNSKRKDEKD